MNDLFLALFLFSLLVLVSGIVKPSLFSHILKKNVTRKKLGLIFGSVAVIFFILFGITGETKPAEKATQLTESQSTEQAEQTEEFAQTTESQPASQETTQQSQTQPEPQSEPEPEPQPEPESEPIVSFGNGTHIVGTDIKPKTYRSQGTRTCYWARLSGFGGQLDDIIANGNNSPEIITISASDVAFETSGCGQWVVVENTYPATPAISFSDGTYEVGKHIESGTYRADGSPDDLCYWARLSNFSHSGISGITTNGNSPTVIQISGSDKGFTTFGCGNWTKI